LVSDFGRTGNSFVAEGLLLEKPESTKKGSVAEVKALGAAIYLAVAGKSFASKFGNHSVGKVYEPEAIVTALKENVSGLPLNDGAKLLVEVRVAFESHKTNLIITLSQELIANGGTGLEKSYTSEEVWENVFG
jgi:hypothetical protein